VIARDFAAQTENDFERAHSRAFMNRVLALLLGRAEETRLLSFEEVKQKIGWNQEIYVGMRIVPVAAIIGSVGRYQDFDRAFLPVQRATRGRWRSIDDAHYRDIQLPPVQLYGVGDVYFVKDGNHRVSVARRRGVEFIDAEVIECRARVPLTPETTAEDLEAIGEYADFLEWSKLDQLRPGQDIRFTIPGGYVHLRDHVSVHRYYMGEKARRPITRVEAVTSWYDNVYMPVVRLIREDEILKKFPRRTEADLYLWIMDHLYYLRERAGDKVGAKDATSDFVEHFARRSLLAAIRHQITPAQSEKQDDRPTPK
jgi:Domain of unknown function (DUF4032)